jgi:aspartyl-tRNA(Asn)/glutamyl-tRNA(Gln) amidotransferase subunit A
VNVPSPYATAIEIRDAIARGERTAEAICIAALERITELNPSLNAFVAVAGDAAVERARHLDRSGGAGSLHGVPVALKDNIVTRDLPTTAGSRILDGYVAPYDATVVERLEAAGAVIIGKTTCDEFAMGSSTEHAATGPARNPWNHDRTPGGSSGGSAVAVAAGMTPIALGSDTGGSVRQPAALCGVVGFKPTYGRVSRYGLIAFASSLDQIGPFAHSMADVRLVMDAIGGPDVRDATSAPRQPAAASSSTDLRGVRIGIPRRLLQDGVDPDVATAFDAAVSTLGELGASVSDVDLPHSQFAIPVYYLIATAEASSNLARFDGVRYGTRAAGVRSLAELYGRTRSRGFGAEVKRRIMLGTYVLSAGYYDAYYLKAQQVRTLIAEDFTRAWEHVDVVAVPTSPTPAFRLGERLDDPVQMYLADLFTVAPSLAGLPSVSVPCGSSGDRLPIGLQLTGAAWSDPELLRVASVYQDATPWHRRHPRP